MSESWQFCLEDEDATLALGAKLAGLLQPGMYIALRGELGSGKTTLVRGMLRALGHDGHVKSPTYALVEAYEVSGLNFYHFDFYRFADPHELIDAGLREAFNGTAVCVVEWPERAEGFLPRPDLSVTLRVSGQGRTALIEAQSEIGKDCLRRLQP
ncbi:MAG TPA: tRNA (adenosine(37)-N6)-threonylcarbamoyltransferase complex ATPase subunit type 1 TsaE [Burkholderiales bacterium]|jgi:tRNA threonylcarbamoyladenosine biosynthesis protein TsaE|nr:tRNA (adenosine(37)-N6)-threonylcarbamoyltransferase complex ATPase subunit type 1 TsaE [Burkholderiales bacterium]